MISSQKPGRDPPPASEVLDAVWLVPSRLVVMPGVESPSVDARAPASVVVEGVPGITSAAGAEVDVVLVVELVTTGAEVVVEEFMEGEEASLFVLSDGEAAVALAPAQDHKRAHDGDAGPNTRGALLAFQLDEGLSPTGELDVPTRDLLRWRHRS